MPPPFWNSGRRSAQKNELHVGEDLFFLVFTKIWAENEPILSEDLFFLKFSGSSFQKSCVRYSGYNNTSIVMLIRFYCFLSSAVIFFSFIFL